MSKADTGLSTANPDRRAVLSHGVGICAAITATAALTGGPAIAASDYSPEFRECIRIWNEWNAAPLDSAADEFCDQFEEAVHRLIDVPVTAWSQVAELAIIWRMRCWDGDECVGMECDPPVVQRAVWKAIEKLSGSGAIFRKGGNIIELPPLV